MHCCPLTDKKEPELQAVHESEVNENVMHCAGMLERGTHVIFEDEYQKPVAQIKQPNEFNLILILF